jgi:glutamate carboxypeptidase
MHCREKIQDYLQDREAEQFQLLKELVLLPSYSRDKAGVDAVGRHLAASLQGTGMRLEVVPEEVYGDQLVFRSPACGKGAKPLLLFGHLDTVFPPESGFSWYREEGEIVRGPGVIDMKGGLVVAVFAIRALAAVGLLEKIPLTLICNSEEEIGSPASTALFEREAAGSCLALGFECGGLDGEVVTGRKGRAGFTLRVAGRAGHAAFAGPDKASAILELAHKVIALEALNDPQRQIVLNVGVVRGGIGPNTVAEQAEAEIDTRFLQLADAADTTARIEAIAAACRVPGTSAALEVKSTRPPMEQSAGNRALFARIDAEARRLGQPCREQLRSGVSDANTIALAGIPVVDGLGPIGEHDHSDREYMRRDSLPARTLLAASFLGTELR